MDGTGGSLMPLPAWHIPRFWDDAGRAAGPEVSVGGNPTFYGSAGQVGMLPKPPGEAFPFLVSCPCQSSWMRDFWSPCLPQLQRFQAGSHLWLSLPSERISPNQCQSQAFPQKCKSQPLPFPGGGLVAFGAGQGLSPTVPTPSCRPSPRESRKPSDLHTPKEMATLL